MRRKRRKKIITDGGCSSMFSGQRTRSHESRGGRRYWLPIIFFSYFPIRFTPSSSVAIRLCVRAARKLVQYWSHSAEQFNWIFPKIFIRWYTYSTRLALVVVDFGGGKTSNKRSNIISTRSQSQRHWSLDLTALFLWLKRNGFFFFCCLNQLSDSDFIIFSFFFLHGSKPGGGEQWGECSAARFCGVRVRFENEK